MVKKLTGLLICLALVGATALPVYAAPHQDSPIVDAIRQIATVVIDILIGISVALMAVGIATGFVGGQFLVTVGQPYGLSSAWIKVVSIVILGVGALLTITIVNTVIDAIAGLVPPTVIPSI